MYEVDFYTRGNGDCPFEECFAGLDIKLRAKTLRSLQLLREFGKELREPNTKPLDDGLFELRTVQGTNRGRSTFFFYDGQRIVVTSGFVKKTKKTSPREIERARRYRREYEENKRHRQ